MTAENQARKWPIQVIWKHCLLLQLTDLQSSRKTVLFLDCLWLLLKNLLLIAVTSIKLNYPDLSEIPHKNLDSMYMHSAQTATCNAGTKTGYNTLSSRLAPATSSSTLRLISGDSSVSFLSASNKQSPKKMQKKGIKAYPD